MHHQRLLVVASFLATFSGSSSSSSALAAAMPAPGGAGGAGEQQKPLGQRLPPMSGVTMRQYMSCEETYDSLWTTCGDGSSRSCYSPALGQSCCHVDNNYCDRGTWCAPVPGYCCLDSEDLETCARNAGFELPDMETLRDLARTGGRESTSSRTRPEI